MAAPGRAGQSIRYRRVLKTDGVRVRQVVCAAVAALAAACGRPDGDTAQPGALLDPDVTVTGGTIRGAPAAGDPDVVAFQGVPYAAPPVGDLRWKPPRPVVAWDGVRNATAPGPICMQTGPAWVRAPTAAEDDPQSEDCLHLNVWAPREPVARAPLPVMVWVHGGGFFNGAGSLPIYDGARLAAHGVVLVTLNYRLNVFGFFAHPALSAESLHGASGNYGLLDVVAALAWVRDNIAAFGGDPQRVTLFGESAGGGAVMAMLLVPQAEGLFHRAISQSTWVYGWDRELAAAEAQGVRIAKALGAAGGTALATLRAAAAEDVQAAANADPGDLLERTGYVWAPNVDGHVVPSDPLDLYDAGRQHDVPLVTGVNADEGASIALRSGVEDAETFETHVRTVYPGVADELLAHYGVTTPATARAQIARLVHDLYFAGPVRVQAAAHAQVSSPVWLYRFSRVPPTALGAAVDAAYHGAELVYVFGTMAAGPGPPGGSPHPMARQGDWTAADRRLSAAMMAWWTQFAATGDPNRGDLPAWPAFEPATGRRLDLGAAAGIAVTGDDALHRASERLFRRVARSRRAGP